jgi:phage/plasmid primase-like uncharacterized protein
MLVAKALRKKHPDLQLILCADDDYQTAGNPGLSKATEAALSTGALLAVPDFGATRPEKATDFNDLHHCAGLDAVRRCIEERSASPANLDDDPPQADEGEELGGAVPSTMAKPQRPRLRPMLDLNASSAAAASG